MASKKEKIDLISVQLGLDSEEFETSLKALTEGVKGDKLTLITKRLASLGTVAEQASSKISQYINKSVLESEKSLDGLVEYIKRSLETDMGLSLTWGKNLDNAASLTVENLQKAYTAYARQTIEKITPQKINDVVDSVGSVKISNGTLSASAGARKQISKLINDIQSGADIESKWGSTINSMVKDKGWTGKSEAEIREMALTMANWDKAFGVFSQLGASTADKAEVVDEIIRKAIPAVESERKLLLDLQDRLGDFVTNLTYTINKSGEITSLGYSLKTGDTTLRGRLNREEMKTITAVDEVNPEGMVSVLRSNAYYASTKIEDNEVAQREQFQKLLEKEYDISLKIEEADAKGNEILKNKLEAERKIVQAEQELINTQRKGQGREALTKESADMGSASNRNLSQELEARNQAIIPIIKAREAEEAKIREGQEKEKQDLREINSLLEKENSLQVQISKLKQDSTASAVAKQELADIQQRLKVFELLSPKYKDIISDTRVLNEVERENKTVINELLTLESQRHNAHMSQIKAEQSGNSEQAEFFNQRKQDYEQQYNQLLQVQYANNKINSSMQNVLKMQQQEHQMEVALANARQRDIEKQKEQSTLYNDISSKIKKYVDLVKQRQKLEAKGASSSKSIYNTSYKNTVNEINEISSSLGIMENNGVLAFENIAHAENLASEQQEKLKQQIQQSNAAIAASANEIAEKQKLETINKMVTAYSRLQKARAELNRITDKNYNEASINRQKDIVKTLQREYNALLQNNKELSQSDEFTAALAKAQESLNAHTASANNGITQQTGLLTRLRNNLERTAATAFNFNIFNTVFMKLREGISSVIEKTKEFDKTMTDIQMVTNKTDASVTKLLANYSELAKQLGVTTSVVSEGSIEWF